MGAPTPAKPTPLRNSYWVLPGKVLAGEHPSGTNREATRERLNRLIEAGVECFIDLTEPGEIKAYDPDLPFSVEYLRKPIKDHSTPSQRVHMVEILDCLHDALQSGRCVYVHCRAGIGRTGTVVGCFLVERGLAGEAALDELNRLWQQSERSQNWGSVPETQDQSDYVLRWKRRGIFDDIGGLSHVPAVVDGNDEPDVGGGPTPWAHLMLDEGHASDGPAKSGADRGSPGTRSGAARRSPGARRSADSPRAVGRPSGAQQPTDPAGSPVGPGSPRAAQADAARVAASQTGSDDDLLTDPTSVAKLFPSTSPHSTKSGHSARVRPKPSHPGAASAGEPGWVRSSPTTGTSHGAKPTAPRSTSTHGDGVHARVPATASPVANSAAARPVRTQGGVADAPTPGGSRANVPLTGTSPGANSATRRPAPTQDGAADARTRGGSGANARPPSAPAGANSATVRSTPPQGSGTHARVPGGVTDVPAPGGFGANVPLTDASPGANSATGRPAPMQGGAADARVPGVGFGANTSPSSASSGANSAAMRSTPAQGGTADVRVPDGGSGTNTPATTASSVANFAAPRPAPTQGGAADARSAADARAPGGFGANASLPSASSDANSAAVRSTPTPGGAADARAPGGFGANVPLTGVSPGANAAATRSTTAQAGTADARVPGGGFAVPPAPAQRAGADPHMPNRSATVRPNGGRSADSGTFRALEHSDVSDGGELDPLLSPEALVAVSHLRDRFLGALIGLATGDAVAAATQYRRPGSFTPIGDMLGGGPFDLPRGGWSDDTAMALCLADSLLERNGFDARDQVERYRRWQQQGYLSSTGQCVGITASTARAIAMAQWRRQALFGSHDPSQQDPEPLSRVAPAVLFFFATSGEAINQAAEAARTTCQAPTVLDACRALARAVHAALTGQPKAVVLEKAASAVVAASADFSTNPVGPGGAVPQRTGMSATAALAAAVAAFGATDNFRDAILYAANLGGDSDVVTAVCGQLAGAYYSVKAIPTSWHNGLMQKELIASYADRLLAHAMVGLSG